MVGVIIGILVFFKSLLGISQPARKIRYQGFVFSEISIQSNLSYQERAPLQKNQVGKFDWYEPKGDTLTKRPLIIWLHGGGFRTGSKEQEEIQLWSKTFAQRGYVCAAINYTLSVKNDSLTRREFLRKACYTAVEDLNHAIVYFKRRSREYRIDTSKIIVGGNSAGGFIALQAAFCSERPSAPHTNTPPNPNAIVPAGKIAGVINFWGALFDLACLKNNQTPLVSVHADKDKTVPYSEKDNIFGSNAIYERAKELKIPNALKTYSGLDHQLQETFNPTQVDASTKSRWLQAGQQAADFLYAELFQKRK